MAVQSGAGQMEPCSGAPAPSLARWTRRATGLCSCAWSAAALDVVLDRQQAEIAGALVSLEAERMADDADLLAAALELDLVDADDFGKDRS